MNIKFIDKSKIEAANRINLDLNGLLSSKIRLPEINEQREIGKILDLCTKEIGLLKNEIQILKKQMEGLMQLLLSGIVRVNCN